MYLSELLTDKVLVSLASVTGCPPIRCAKRARTYVDRLALFFILIHVEHMPGKLPSILTWVRTADFLFIIHQRLGEIFILLIPLCIYKTLKVAHLDNECIYIQLKNITP